MIDWPATIFGAYRDGMNTTLRLDTTIRHTSAQTMIYLCATQHGWHVDERNHRQERYRRGADRALITYTVDGQVSCAEYRIHGRTGHVDRHHRAKLDRALVVLSW